MKIAFAAAAASIALIAVAAAAPRNVAGFSAVSARSGTDVEVTVGPAFSVDVSGRDADRIVTRVSGDTLIVETRRGWSWRGRSQARVRVTMPHVDGLSASSGADLTVTGVNAAEIRLDASSGADLRVSGSCGRFRADASSGSDIHAQNLRCENGSADVSSGADIRIYASNRLDVDASSGGGVVAYGDPGIGDIDLSSGGSLRRAD